MGLRRASRRLPCNCDVIGRRPSLQSQVFFQPCAAGRPVVVVALRKGVLSSGTPRGRASGSRCNDMSRSTVATSEHGYSRKTGAAPVWPSVCPRRCDEDPEVIRHRDHRFPDDMGFGANSRARSAQIRRRGGVAGRKNRRCTPAEGSRPVSLVADRPGAPPARAL